MTPGLVHGSSGTELTCLVIAVAPRRLQIDGFQSFSSILKLSEIGIFINHYNMVLPSFTQN